LGMNFPGRFTIPLALALSQSQMLQSLLDAILWSIISIAIVLCSILIYSLLLSEVDAQTYELGLLRALGMKTTAVSTMLVLKSTFFSSSGLPLGWGLTALALIPVTQLIAGYVALDVGVVGGLSWSTIRTTLLIGFIVPLLANIGPVSRALGKTLRDSLSLYQNAISEAQVRILKLAEEGLDVIQMTLGFMLTLTGVATFVLIPSGFVSQNFALVLGVLDCIFMLMILGFIILSTLLQDFFEKCILRLLTLDVCNRGGANLAIRAVVEKNLKGHRSRNAKTALMFTIGMGFVLFAGVVSTLQSQAIVDGLRQAFGSDIYGFVFGYVTTSSIDEAGMRKLLDGMKKSKQIVGYTFTGVNLNSLDSVNHVWFSNLAGYPHMHPIVTPLEDNFLDVAYSEYAVFTENFSSTDIQLKVPDQFVLSGRNLNDHTLQTLNASLNSNNASLTTDSLFTSRKSYQNLQKWTDMAYESNCSLILPENYRNFVNVDTKQYVMLNVRYYAPDGSQPLQHFLCTVQHMASKYPAYYLSAHEASVAITRVLIPMADVARMVSFFTGTQVNQTAIPKKKVLIKVPDHLTSLQRQKIMDSVRLYIKSQNSIVLDIQDLVETTSSSLQVLTIFFVVIGAVAMTLCFLILVLSVTANVRSNSWELGVLRSLGINVPTSFAPS
jgi:hypothetical protein